MGVQTPWWMVVLLGMGIVFAGLGLLVLMCDGLRLVFYKGKAAKPAAQPLPAAPAQTAVQGIQDRKKLLAIAAAAIAEAEGTDAPGFRIISLTRRKSA